MMNLEKEIKDFIEKLKEEKSNDRKQRKFLLEHKFNREAKFYEERINTIEAIQSALELVVEGKSKGSEVRFYFD